MRKNDRVENEYLGEGTIIKILKTFPKSYLVKWDNTPNIRYNMGENPCMVFHNEIKKIKSNQVWRNNEKKK